MLTGDHRACQSQGHGQDPTFSLWKPDVVSHEVWNFVVHLIDQLQDIVDEKDSVIVPEDQPFVIL